MYKSDQEIIKSVVNVVRLDSNDNLVAIVGRAHSNVCVINLRGRTKWVDSSFIRKYPEVKIGELRRMGMVLDSYYNQVPHANT